MQAGVQRAVWRGHSASKSAGCKALATTSGWTAPGPTLRCGRPPPASPRCAAAAAPPSWWGWAPAAAAPRSRLQPTPQGFTTGDWLKGRPTLEHSGWSGASCRGASWPHLRRSRVLASGTPTLEHSTAPHMCAALNDVWRQDAGCDAMQGVVGAASQHASSLPGRHSHPTTNRSSMSPGVRGVGSSPW